MTEQIGRRQLVGKVVSDRMSSTVVVEVTRLVRHPVYKRVIRRAKKFKAHDAGLKPRVGDEVRMEEMRPISVKRWLISRFSDDAVTHEAIPTRHRLEKRP